ncbi:MAG: hypothetical protein ACLU7D_07070 [Collinsella sp.]
MLDAPEEQDVWMLCLRLADCAAMAGGNGVNPDRWIDNQHVI